MEREHRSRDDGHDRRWRRDPFGPASFRRPGRRDDHEPREPRSEGDEGSASSERPPTSPS